MGDPHRTAVKAAVLGSGLVLALSALAGPVRGEMISAPPATAATPAPAAAPAMTPIAPPVVGPPAPAPLPLPAAPRPGGSKRAKAPRWPTVTLFQVNRHETLRYRIADDQGRPVRGLQKRMNRFLRCHLTNQQHAMNPRL